MKKLTRLRLEGIIAQRSERYAYRMREARGIVEYARPERVEKIPGLTTLARGATELAWRVVMNEWRRGE